MSTAVTPPSPGPSPGPPSPERARAVYRGPGGMRGLATSLQMMVHEGTEAARIERDRWSENRSFYRGDQWIQHHPATGRTRVLTSAQINQSTNGRRRDILNRLRTFVDGRLALYANERPPFEVIPPNHTQKAVEGAHQARKLVEAMWGPDGWNVKGTFSDLGRAGEIDGISWLCVEWDPTKGPESNLPYVVTPDGEPVTDPADIAALKEMDPEGQTLWRQLMPPGPIGDVRFRVVRAGAMSVDPLVVSDFSEAFWCCESRVISKAQAEKLAGRSWKEITGESDVIMGREPRSDFGGSMSPGATVDTGEAGWTRQARDAVVVNLFYHRPGGDFPNGMRCIWFDDAPGAPAVIEPWKDELPYRPFTPRPDGGQIFACRGTVDDLKPIQRRLNRTLSNIHMWLDRIALTPVGIPRGSLVGDSIYNEKGHFELNPGMGEPSYMRAPPEPVATLTQHVQWMLTEMAAISAQTEAVRGETMGSREAASSIQLRIQQSEQQLAGSTAELIRAYEWGLSRALQLVAKNYHMPRAVVMPGTGDSLEFDSFVGAMLGGAHRFKVTGSIQPATRAAEMQTLLQFAPVVGADIRPHIAALLGGDTTGFKHADEAQRRRARRRCRAIAALASNDMAATIHENFQQEVQRYGQALQEAAQQAASMPPQVGPPGPDGMPSVQPPPSPQEILAQMGVVQPRLLDALSQANIQIPGVEVQDDPIQQLAETRLWMVGEAFERMHPMVHQAAREVSERLTERMTQQLMAAGQQDPAAPPGPGEEPGDAPRGEGSAPAPKGQPSPPRQTGQPAGTPPMRLPG